MVKKIESLCWIFGFVFWGCTLYILLKIIGILVHDPINQESILMIIGIPSGIAGIYAKNWLEDWATTCKDD